MIVKRWKNNHAVIFVLEVALYSQQVVVFFGKDTGILLKCLKSVTIPEVYEDYKSFVESSTLKKGMLIGNSDYKSSLLWLPQTPSTCEQYAALAHEIFHTTVAIMRGIGVDNLTFDNEEAYAYVTGYLTETILLELNRCKNISLSNS